MRYLYSLGFEKTSGFENGKEYWTFEITNELNESLDFYFYMRKKLKELRIIDGVNGVDYYGKESRKD